MPLPIAHTAAGLAVYITVAWRHIPNGDIRTGNILLLTLLLIANIPDSDFIPGILINQPNRFHHGISHSLFTATLLAMIVIPVLRKYIQEIPLTVIATAVWLAAVSHPLLDAFSVDHSIPYGVPLLWPFDEQFWISDWSLFPDVKHDGTSNASFISSILSMHNAATILVEFIFSCIIVLLAMAISNRGSVYRARFYLSGGILLIPVLLAARMLVV